MASEVFNRAFSLVLEYTARLRSENFCEDLSCYLGRVGECVHAALASYILRLELFRSMSMATIFNRVSTNVEDSHSFFLVMLVLSFSLFMTFVGVKARKMFVFYPFITGCIYFLIVSPVRNSAFFKQAEGLYSTEAVAGIENFAHFARQIDLHMIAISFVLATIMLYFYNMMKYVPALVLILSSWNVFVLADAPTNYVSFAVFAIFLLYVYSKIFSAIERVVLATVFSFVGSFILVAHANIASPAGSNYIPSYEEFLRTFSAEGNICINNVCTILFVLIFILGIWKQLEGRRKSHQ